MILYFTLAVSTVLAAMLVYRFDLYEREPWPMLLLATMLGAAAGRIAGHAEILTLGWPWFGGPEVSLSSIAAVEEELARLAMVVFIALAAPRQFNDPMDGLIYGRWWDWGWPAKNRSRFCRGNPVPLPRSPPRSWFVSSGTWSWEASPAFSSEWLG